MVEFTCWRVWTAGEFGGDVPIYGGRPNSSKD